MFTSKPSSLFTLDRPLSLGHHTAEGHSAHPSVLRLALNPLAEILSSHTVRSLVAERPLVALTDTDTIGTCITTLANNRIHSLPVLSHGTCVGFVDLLDIARHMAALSPNPVLCTEQELTGFMSQLEETPLYELLEARTSSQFFAVSQNDLASRPASVMAHGVHRLAMYANKAESKKESLSTATATATATSGEGEAVFTGVCSQSDLVKFIASKCQGASGPLEAMLKRPIHSFVGQGLHLQSRWLSSELLNAGKKAEKAGMPGFQVICLNERATVFTAIQSMALAGSRCLAIVDDDGNLSGNFSVSDLSFVFFSKVEAEVKLPTAEPQTGLTALHDPLLQDTAEASFPAGELFFMSVRDYLQKYRPSSLRPLVEENPDAPLSSIIKKLVDHNVSHLFTVNKGDKKPAGIVSLTDILRIVRVYQHPHAVVPTPAPKPITQFDIADPTVTP